MTRRDILAALARSFEAAGHRMEAGAVASDFGADDPERAAHESSAPLGGYEIVDLRITVDSPASNRRVGEISWPDGALVVGVSDGGQLMPALPDTLIRAGGESSCLPRRPRRARASRRARMLKRRALE